jgi:PAS domain S-box-containing protein
MNSDLEARYRALFETTLDAMMIVDNDGCFVDVNDNLCRLLKAPRAQLIGAHFSQFIPAELLGTSAVASGHLRTLGSLEGEFALRATDGSLIEVEWRARANFTPGLHLWAAREITARKQAEARCAAILETALDAIITMNHEGRILDFNPAAVRIFGYRRAEVLGRPMAELLIPPASREGPYQTLLRHLESGESALLGRRVELSALRSDGSEFPIELAVTRLPGEGPSLFTACIRDISAQKRADQRGAVEHATARILAEAVTLGEAAPSILQVLCEYLDAEVGELWEVDPDRELLQCSAGWVRPHSQKLEQFQAASRELTSAWGVGLAGHVWKEQTPATVRALAAYPNFPRLPLARAAGLRSGIAFPLRSREGPFGVCAFFGVHPFELDEPLAEMMTAIGHDMAQFIRRCRAEKSLEVERERLRRTLERMAFQRERLDLGRLVRLTLHDHRQALEDAGISLELHLPATPVWVMGDATRLSQALDHLLEHARRSSARGGQVRIDLEPTPAEMQATLRVADTGVGLDRNLALVEELIGLHNGSVEAIGAGSGAGLLLRLPLEPEPPALSEKPEARAKRTEKLQVLVVEDNSDAAQSLRHLLETFGYEVTVALTGPAGLEAAEKDTPDVILCDIGLPGMDGYSLAEAIRQNPRLSHTRLVALTGYGRQGDIRRSQEAGFDEHLVKPVDPDRLLRQLELS